MPAGPTPHASVGGRKRTTWFERQKPNPFLVHPIDHPMCADEGKSVVTESKIDPNQYIDLGSSCSIHRALGAFGVATP
jgi:hypothetical protein